MLRLLVFAAALLFILALGLLTALYIKSSGLTVVGVLGLVVLIICAIGVLGAILHDPRQ